MVQKTAPIRFSPTASEAFDLCEKKYFFMWLSQRRSGWIPRHMEINSPLFQVYLTNKIEDASRWSGSLFHQIMKKIFNDISNPKQRTAFSPDTIRRIAYELASLQFDYSRASHFMKQKPIEAPVYEGLSTYLVLSEHYHQQNDEGLLLRAQQDVDLWLSNTFAWDSWHWLLNLATKNPLRVEAEPEHRVFHIGDVSLSARMDLGIETWDSQFFIFDWKCQQIDEQFRDHQLDKYRRQLLAYAAYPVFRDSKPLQIENIHTLIYNPIEGKSYPFTFTENDLLDFESQVQDWRQLHLLMFPNQEEVDFDELAEPASPETVCPHCEFQTICRANIQWQNQS